LRKIPKKKSEWTRQGETFDWGYGFALPRLYSRPQEGSGEECGRVSEPFRFCRRNSYFAEAKNNYKFFASQNAPQKPKVELCLPHPPVRTQHQFCSLKSDLTPKFQATLLGGIKC
jgi:hypothetical protein